METDFTCHVVHVPPVYSMFVCSSGVDFTTCSINYVANNEVKPVLNCFVVGMTKVSDSVTLVPDVSPSSYVCVREKERVAFAFQVVYTNFTNKMWYK